MSKPLSVNDMLVHLSEQFYPHQFIDQHGPALRQALPHNRQVLISSMPKTGSTLLFRAMALAIGRPINLVTYSTDGNEQELYFPLLAQAALTKPGLCRLHMRATRPNLALIRAFNLTPIVQVRDIFDILASQRDHILRGLYGTMGQVTPDESDLLNLHFKTLNVHAQFDLLIDLKVPWLLDFFRGWHDAEQRGDVTIHWMDYRDLNRDKVGTIAKAIEFLGMPAIPQRIAAAVAALPPEKTRFNQAKEGRGHDLMSDAQKQRIIAMTRHYPWVDFSRIGIAPVQADARQAA